MFAKMVLLSCGYVWKMVFYAGCISRVGGAAGEFETILTDSTSSQGQKSCLTNRFVVRLSVCFPGCCTKQNYGGK